MQPGRMQPPATSMESKEIEMVMLKKILVMCGICVLLQPAYGQDLITAEEVQREQAAQTQAEREPVRRTRSLPVPGTPKIEVLSPNVAGAVHSPFEIRLKFVPENGTQIVVDSFKVLYGVFGLDITSRVMKLAEFSNNTLRIDRANIPPGKHRLLLRIKDSQHREGQQELTVVVRE